MPYKALTTFLDGKQRLITAEVPFPDDYDESTLEHYKRNGMIEEVAAPKPKPKVKKPAAPKETK